MTDTTLDLFGVTGAVVMAGRRDESRAAAQMADSVKPVESSALAFNPPLPVTAPSEPPRYAPAVVLAAIAPAALPSAPVDLPVFKAPAAAKPDATKPKVHGAIDDPDGAEAALQAASHLVKPGETLGKLLRQAYGSADQETLAWVKANNPQISDINHVEAGQTLHFPQRPSGLRVSVPPGVDGGLRTARFRLAGLGQMRAQQRPRVLIALRLALDDDVAFLLGGHVKHMIGGLNATRRLQLAQEIAGRDGHDMFGQGLHEPPPAYVTVLEQQHGLQLVGFGNRRVQHFKGRLFPASARARLSLTERSA